ncbi:MAG: hypothetical protein PWQ15_876 [Methanobacterium sp.]|jgi:hypothetical protein|uniref:hypothetical protein n=1 Tax=Methanobacterium sp. TaxID=2164 RepID=UPI0003C95DB4|nr:hypothetical protein [Methanobacterium sp.]MDI3549774.1 hypothetical protein [Methanobacterium sp.]CDG65845.1 hypothetical protein MBMB1_1761 [Methanobacterium sp. MB1]
MESVEVLAVEIKQYTDDKVTTLVSRVMGQPIEAQAKKTRNISSGLKLNKETFFENLKGAGYPFYEDSLISFKKRNLDPYSEPKDFIKDSN